MGRVMSSRVCPAGVRTQVTAWARPRLLPPPGPDGRLRAVASSSTAQHPVRMTLHHALRRGTGYLRRIHGQGRIFQILWQALTGVDVDVRALRAQRRGGLHQPPPAACLHRQAGDAQPCPALRKPARPTVDQGLSALFAGQSFVHSLQNGRVRRVQGHGRSQSTMPQPSSVGASGGQTRPRSNSRMDAGSQPWRSRATSVRIASLSSSGKGWPPPTGPAGGKVWPDAWGKPPAAWMRRLISLCRSPCWKKCRQPAPVRTKPCGTASGKRPRKASSRSVAGSTWASCNAPWPLAQGQGQGPSKQDSGS